MRDQAIVVLITAPSLEVGRAIADKLVKEELAACVNLLPGIESVYSWQGKLQRDAEVLLIVKSRAERFGDLEQAVRAAHPYEVPEIIGLPVEWGSQPYLDWIAASTPQAK